MSSNNHKEITFKDLNLAPELQQALNKLEYSTPTPIQSQSIPDLLQGRDMIGIAQTGTGKTASFTLPILHRMKEEYPRKIKTLILAPTRELAAQIGESIATYGQFLKFKHTVIFGGVSQFRQVQDLTRGVDIVVATPGRLMDLLQQKKLTLKHVEFFVLDEADRMLDMGFIHDIKKVLAQLPKHKQSLFFSATMSPEINKLAKQLLKNPIHVEITPSATTVEKIRQKVFFVDVKIKLKLLLSIFNSHDMGSVLVFTRTKHRANKVATFLNKNNIYADAIHGNKSQNARTKAIKDFKSGAIKVLVATDIAARGIDIPNISHVINFELPNESESYVHRIGRTARAGTDGTAYSFCEAQERNYLRDIEKLTKQNLEIVDHEFHSNAAQDATGAAARPPPKGQRGGRGGQRNKRGSSQRNRTSKKSSRGFGNSKGKSSRFSKGKSSSSRSSKSGNTRSYKSKNSSSGSSSRNSKPKRNYRR